MANGAMSTATNNDLSREKNEFKKMGMGYGTPKKPKGAGAPRPMAHKPKMRSFTRAK
jgi:hypothetical protein